MAKRILVVDNDQAYVDQLRSELELMGMEVITAGDMSEASFICDKLRPDLAIMEIMLDYADGGFTLCHQIKKKDPTIPIMLVSNVAVRTGMTFNVSTQEERSWIKADSFLDKPVPFETIKKEIKRLLA
jgi:DNA-binding response OmpR family regulator